MPPPDPDPRNYFAAERTFLAWIRTGLSLMGFGFVVARFGLFLREIAAATGEQTTSTGFSKWFGVSLIVLGVLVTGAGALSHVQTVRRLNRGEPFVGRPTWVGVMLALVLVAIGLLMTLFLFSTA